ncbi:MAG TPA: extracellular solute-binding protein [Chloroflexota bacterium]|nr:extracellular solute-binding protein [Chloroflexota bacterium]
MKRFLLAFVLLATALAGCGGAAAPAASSPAAKPTTWDGLVAAAKKEGTVSVIVPPGDNIKAALVDAFEAKYPGIAVDALPSSGSAITSRVMSERGANKYLWDVFVNGITDLLTTFIPANALEPIPPALMLPEVTDPKNWRDGGIEYLDKDKMVLVTTRTVYPTLWVNPTMIKPDQITSYKDFLAPAWKGKFILDDPKKSGPGQALLTLWYLTPGLGPDFVKAIAAQQPLILTDYTQEANMVGQGRYAALLGGSDQTLSRMVKEGLPIAVVPPEQLKEPVQVAAGATGAALFTHAPHPNAAKVYLNWLLSKDGQAAFAPTQPAVSNRLDVPATYLESWRVPVPGAIKTYGTDVLAVRDNVIALAKEAFQ